MLDKKNKTSYIPGAYQLAPGPLVNLDDYFALIHFVILQVLYGLRRGRFG